MIPMMMPTPGTIYNITQLVRVKEITADGNPENLTALECTFTGGVKQTFTGDAARIARAEIAFVFNNYRQLIQSMQQPSLVQPVNGKIIQ